MMGEGVEREGEKASWGCFEFEDYILEVFLALFRPKF